MKIDLQYTQMLIHQAQQNGESFTPEQLIPLLDLTRLEDTDDEASITELCEQAQTPYGSVAAVCVYPKFVPIAQRLLSQTTIKIATVINFPGGNDDISTILADIDQAITQGATEIDMVIPLPAFLDGDHDAVKSYVRRCKELCGQNIALKVILETGSLQTLEKIAIASHEAVTAGADFIKTSTGKTPDGASLEAVATMLLTNKNSGMPCGLKVSGGVRSYQQACEYLSLTELVMGKEWLTAEHFRIGASSLLHALLKQIEER